MRRFVEITEIAPQKVERNHDGEGPIQFRRLLTGADFMAPVDFVDFTVIPPGSTIGLHEHSGNEEIYFIAKGKPRVMVEGEERRLKPGSIAVVHSGQCHRLINDCRDDVEILVIQIRQSPAL